MAIGVYRARGLPTNGFQVQVRSVDAQQGTCSAKFLPAEGFPAEFAHLVEDWHNFNLQDIDLLVASADG